MAKLDPEPDLVQSAYEDQVKLLYKQLCVELSSAGGVPGPADEQKAMQHFRLGLTLARRARELALSAVQPAVSTAAVSAQAATSFSEAKSEAVAKARARRAPRAARTDNGKPKRTPSRRSV